MIVVVVIISIIIIIFIFSVMSAGNFVSCTLRALFKAGHRLPSARWL